MHETLAHNGNHYPANTIIRRFSDIYQECTARIEGGKEGASLAIEIEGATRALVDLNLFLTNFSPLTTAPLTDDAKWDVDDNYNDDEHDLSWLDEAMDREQPPESKGDSAENHAREVMTWRLCGDPQFRINLVKDLYGKLDRSVVKARCAYVLGHFAIHKADAKAPAQHHKEAERLLFECLYILDTITCACCPAQVIEVFALARSPLVFRAKARPWFRRARRSCRVCPWCRSWPATPSCTTATCCSPTANTCLPWRLTKGPHLRLLTLRSFATLLTQRPPPSATWSHILRKGTELHSINRLLCDVCTKNGDLARSIFYHKV
jgi:hypothetical protein